MPEQDGKGVICTITWTEDDVKTALKNRLKREPTAEELEQACDAVFSRQETILDSCIEKGWEIIGMILDGDFE